MTRRWTFLCSLQIFHMVLQVPKFQLCGCKICRRFPFPYIQQELCHHHLPVDSVLLPKYLGFKFLYSGRDTSTVELFSTGCDVPGESLPSLYVSFIVFIFLLSSFMSLHAFTWSCFLFLHSSKCTCSRQYLLGTWCIPPVMGLLGQHWITRGIFLASFIIWGGAAHIGLFTFSFPSKEAYPSWHPGTEHSWSIHCNESNKNVLITHDNTLENDHA